VTESPLPHIRLAQDEELPARLRGSKDNFTRVFGHNAELLDAWMAWYQPLIKSGAVSARLKEMIRLRVAQLNACAF